MVNWVNYRFLSAATIGPTHSAGDADHWLSNLVLLWMNDNNNNNNADDDRNGNK